MAEEFQGGVCGGNWPWNSSRNFFGSSPCSLGTYDIGSSGWPNHDLIMDVNVAARSSEDSAGSASDGGGSVVIQGVPAMDSTFDAMGIGLSSSTFADDWNQDFLHDSARSAQSYPNFLLNSTMDYQHETEVVDDFPQINSMNSFKQVNQSFALQQQPLDNISTSTYQLAATCSGLSGGFPMDSASYNYASSLLQTLFDTDSEHQSSFQDSHAMDYGFLPSLPKASPMVNPSLARKQPTNRLPLTDSEPLWNATAAASSSVRSTFLPSTQSQLLPSSVNKKPNLPSFVAKRQHEEGKNSASVAKKARNEPVSKRPRIDTPSPLPTFKVRKEKLGDRITALQQLVSPFGKTDTASVLHEAIEYIKFLHDQVNALSTPYLKYGSPPLQRQQGADKTKEGLLRDLRSRGLCLVPISSTFPVATETASDFWTPTFGAKLNY